MISPAVRVATAALALGSLAAAQSDVRYEWRGSDLVMLEGANEWLVEMDVVTARLTGDVADFGDLLARVDDDAVAEMLSAWQPLRQNRLGFVDLKLPEGVDPRLAVALLEKTGLVDVAEVNALGAYSGVPNDSSFNQQWGLLNVGQSGGTPGADMNMPAAWDITGGSPDVVIAVLDSGTEHTHPDLAAAIWQNDDEIAGNGVDDDSNGFIDDTIGWDFDGGDNNPAGSFFHGTAVAGCAGAVGNNGIGIAGTGGGGDNGPGCRIMPINVGSFAPIGSILDDAILYAANNGADIITLSLQVPQSSAIDAAVDFAHDTVGCFVDCAAGNSGFSVSYPASLPKVMAVASSNRFDQKSGFSNPGPQVEVAAPGEDIFTTSTGNGYTTTSGTSFAAPHLAGVAGLLLAANPALTNTQIRQILRETAVDIGPAGFDNGTGDGRIDAAAALAIATGGVLGQVLPYGLGLPGINGLVPDAATGGGSPKVGNDGFEFRLTRAAPSSPATLVLGFGQAATPFKGGTLNVNLAGPFDLVTVTTSPTGRALIPAPIPDDDELAGIVFNVQWAIQDIDAIAGIALSQGLEITIGS